MRLICPNCSTQYEVDDSAVPATGREVQCGSCSSTWFQAPARSNVPQNAEKGDLPKWVEDIVEDERGEEAHDLPGQAPRIASEPNQEIVSEPELEVIIDAAPQEAEKTETVVTPDPVPEVEPSQAQKRAEAASAAKALAQSAAAAAIAAKLTGSDRAKSEPAPSAPPVTAPDVPEVAVPTPDVPAMDANIQNTSADAVELAEARAEFNTLEKAREIANTAAPVPSETAASATPAPVEALKETATEALANTGEINAVAADISVEAPAVTVSDQSVEPTAEISAPAPVDVPSEAEDVSALIKSLQEAEVQDVTAAVDPEVIETPTDVIAEAGIPEVDIEVPTEVEDVSALIKSLEEAQIEDVADAVTTPVIETPAAVIPDVDVEVPVAVEDTNDLIKTLEEKNVNDIVDALNQQAAEAPDDVTAAVDAALPNEADKFAAELEAVAKRDADTVPDAVIEQAAEATGEVTADIDLALPSDAEDVSTLMNTLDDTNLKDISDAATEQTADIAAEARADVEVPSELEDVSTPLEAAIKETSSATKEDFAELAAAELEASKAAELNAANAVEEAKKAAEQAAALEMAEKAATRDLEAHSDPVDAAQAAISQAGETRDETDIEAQIRDALEDLETEKTLPENPSEERLVDYDVPDRNDIPDQYVVELSDQENDKPTALGDNFDPEDITLAGSEDTVTQVVTEPSAVDPMVAAIERDAAEDQTESLAAKLKARVAAAAKAQESNAVGTAGVVLGASAAGIAAASARSTTDFPKRDTEELSSSLRPKPVDGNSLKPRLRPAATPEPVKSRFGQGFFMAVALFAVALLIYLFRAQLAVAVPGLESALTAYAGFIDNIRGIFQDAIGKLTGGGASDPQG